MTNFGVYWLGSVSFLLRTSSKSKDDCWTCCCTLTPFSSLLKQVVNNWRAARTWIHTNGRITLRSFRCWRSMGGCVCFVVRSPIIKTPNTISRVMDQPALFIFFFFLFFKKSSFEISKEREKFLLKKSSCQMNWNFCLWRSENLLGCGGQIFFYLTVEEKLLRSNFPVCFHLGRPCPHPTHSME